MELSAHVPGDMLVTPTRESMVNEQQAPKAQFRRFIIAANNARGVYGSPAAYGCSRSTKAAACRWCDWFGSSATPPWFSFIFAYAFLHCTSTPRLLLVRFSHGPAWRRLVIHGRMAFSRSDGVIVPALIF